MIAFIGSTMQRGKEMASFNNMYDKMLVGKLGHHERNDCTVIATAIACNLDYHIAHKMMADVGRKDKHRFNIGLMKEAIIEKGFSIIAHRKLFQSNGSRYTMTTIGKAFPKGHYIVCVRGHVAALINGKVHDWTTGRRHRVNSVWEIVNPLP